MNFETFKGSLFFIHFTLIPWGIISYTKILYDLCECCSNAEIVTKILDYLGL